ncbi:MAG: TIGR03862 family flavoprotein [Burkholderiales bacterium]|nr:TIGR03862 family flavoprotein [Burkholderiales bacterium]
MSSDRPRKVLVVGGGPAGLMAAEVLSAAGVSVELFDTMPSVGRKFLLAGKGGLNLTHSEPIERFESRFGARQAALIPLLHAFGPAALRDWASALGVSTFVGSSGRVFPTDMKAAPLLRAWLQRLRYPASGSGVRFHMRHRWTGVLTQSEGKGIALEFATPTGQVEMTGDAVVLALGGASWARLGSDGAWVPNLLACGVSVAPLLPSNCGFDRSGGWSPFFRDRFAGQAFKSVAIEVRPQSGPAFRRKGEFVATATGVEGSLIYAASSQLRECISQSGRAEFKLDLLPDLSEARVAAEVSHPRGSRSLSSHLKSRLGLDGIKMAVLHECLTKAQLQDQAVLATAIKALPIELAKPRPIDEAISSAGGVRFEALDTELMVGVLPGVFCAGEMLDWEAPTGGYLLTACLATGRRAGQGVLTWLNRGKL